MSALAGLWQSRAPAERKLLAAAALACAIVLVATLAWLPLERLRTRLAAEIPALSASIALMRRQAEEVQRVRPLPASTPATLAPLASLVASGALTHALPGAQAVLADERRLKITASDAAYGSLLESVAQAQGVHGLSVESARIEALAAPGRVRAELVLARP
jgi:type II secretory pathway component PulM